MTYSISTLSAGLLKLYQIGLFCCVMALLPYPQCSALWRKCLKFSLNDFWSGQARQVMLPSYLSINRPFDLTVCVIIHFLVHSSDLLQSVVAKIAYLFFYGFLSTLLNCTEEGEHVRPEHLWDATEPRLPRSSLSPPRLCFTAYCWVSLIDPSWLKDAPMKTWSVKCHPV